MRKHERENQCKRNYPDRRPHTRGWNDGALKPDHREDKVIVRLGESTRFRELVRRLESDATMHVHICGCFGAECTCSMQGASLLLLSSSCVPVSGGLFELSKGWPLPDVLLFDATLAAERWLSTSGFAYRCVLSTLDIDELFFRVQHELEKQSAIRGLVQCSLGRWTIRDVQEQMRRAMLSEALRRSNFSRRKAAKLLGITRSAVQQMISTFELVVPEFMVSDWIEPQSLEGPQEPSPNMGVGRRCNQTKAMH